MNYSVRIVFKKFDNDRAHFASKATTILVLDEENARGAEHAAEKYVKTICCAKEIYSTTATKIHDAVFELAGIR